MDFLESQPVGIESSNYFIKKYQGTYRNAQDSTQLIISKDRIIKLVHFPVVFSKKDIDSTFIGNKNDRNEIQSALAKDNIRVVNVKGDSIYSIWTIKDTLFAISDRNVLIYFKGSYFLNFSKDEISWKAQRLDLNKGRLSIGMIMSNDSLFKAISVEVKNEVKDDSGTVIQYQIKPTKKELKKLIRTNAFQLSEEWIKETYVK